MLSVVKKAPLFRLSLFKSEQRDREKSKNGRVSVIFF
jgi:hypothetical protein